MATLPMKWIADAGMRVRPLGRAWAALAGCLRALADSPLGVLLPLLVVVPLLLLALVFA